MYLFNTINVHPYCISSTKGKHLNVTLANQIPLVSQTHANLPTLAYLRNKSINGLLTCKDLKRYYTF